VVSCSGATSDGRPTHASPTRRRVDQHPPGARPGGGRDISRATPPANTAAWRGRLFDRPGLARHIVRNSDPRLPLLYPVSSPSDKDRG
jgi:hypothetical protein